VDAVRTLAQLGADLEAHDVHGFSPLYMAAGEDHCDVLRVLVEEVRALACPETREWSRFEAADASPCMPQETQSVLAHSLRPKLSRRDAATGLSQAICLALLQHPLRLSHCRPLSALELSASSGSTSFYRART
jgi:hypothetical protein